MTAPKPVPRPDRVSLLTYLRLFRRDILSAQPQRLYRAWMAEFKTPFFRSFLINDPRLIRLVLNDRPEEFPKSDRISAGLRPLLGQSVFVTNGETWKRQRRIIDPAFAGGRIRDSFGAMSLAAAAMADRLEARADGAPVEIEEEASHGAADVIFRTLFSVPIDHADARAVYAAFQAHQRAQPVLSVAAFLPRLGRLWPAPAPVRRTAAEVRALIHRMTADRARLIEAGNAPDDLATRIMTARDPETGEGFGIDEMTDQVVIFFLAGHETSASALAWTLYLLATHPQWQVRAAAEIGASPPSEMAELARLPVTRDVFREALRLYPPVPMMVREASQPERFRDRAVPSGAQIVISPWHLHRQNRLWAAADEFDPGRWRKEADTAAEGAAHDPRQHAYLPFSSGPRVCVGAGFAMAEGVILLAHLLARFRFEPVEGRVPVPQAHLTVRSKNGIWLSLHPRG